MHLSSSKTFKRELAAVMLIFLFYLALADKTQALEILTLPTYTFAALAFGMDWGSKQTNLTKGKPNASSPPEETP